MRCKYSKFVRNLYGCPRDSRMEIIMGIVEKITFCNNVKKLREINKLSKKEMAKRLHISVRSLSMLEQGIIPPKMSMQVAIVLSREFEMALCDVFRAI